MDLFETGTRFYTAKELAELLKMNHQVVLRKLKRGEIEGYKIGKEWRVEEAQLRRWLRSRRNRPPEGETGEEGDRGAGGGPEGSPDFPPVVLTARGSRRRAALETILRVFPRDRGLTEPEVHRILSAFHPGGPALKRELLREGLLVRRGGLLRAVGRR